MNKTISKRILTIIVTILVIAMISVPVYYNQTKPPRLNEGETESADDNNSWPQDIWLDALSEIMIGGGPAKDGIPPIEDPNYISIAEAESFLDPRDAVFLVEIGEVVKIFPQRVMVRHEIVNDIINGENVSITYCPLTGSAIGYRGDIGMNTTTFGTSGRLVNSNLVMYDRATDSNWSQIPGVSISGTLRGSILETFPVIWTTYQLAKMKYPDAVVLSTDQGFDRDYDRDPYGSYVINGTYYQVGPPFNLKFLASDNALPAKEVVVGIRINGSALAIRKSSLADDGIANLRVNDTHIVAVYDESLNTVRTFSREIGDTVLNFELEDGYMFDSETNSKWTISGYAISGDLRGTGLERVHSFDVMWFGWVAFFSETDIYGL